MFRTIWSTQGYSWKLPFRSSFGAGRLGEGKIFSFRSPIPRYPLSQSLPAAAHGLRLRRGGRRRRLWWSRGAARRLVGRGGAGRGVDASCTAARGRRGEGSGGGSHRSRILGDSLHRARGAASCTAAARGEGSRERRCARASSRAPPDGQRADHQSGRAQSGGVRRQGGEPRRAEASPRRAGLQLSIRSSRVQTPPGAPAVLQVQGEAWRLVSTPCSLHLLAVTFFFIPFSLHFPEILNMNFKYSAVLVVESGMWIHK